MRASFLLARIAPGSLPTRARDGGVLPRPADWAGGGPIDHPCAGGWDGTLLSSQAMTAHFRPVSRGRPDGTDGAFMQVKRCDLGSRSGSRCRDTCNTCISHAVKGPPLRVVSHGVDTDCGRAARRTTSLMDDSCATGARVKSSQGVPQDVPTWRGNHVWRTNASEAQSPSAT